MSNQETCLRNSQLQTSANGYETFNFYGVWRPSSTPDEHERAVYTNKNELLLALKNDKEARFKAFRTYEEALNFSNQGPPQLNTYLNKIESSVIEGTSELLLLDKSGTLFHGPKAQDLVKLRKAIQSGDIDYVQTTIWCNPRFLISSGHAPTVLHEGSRYNALHIASNSKQPRMCQLILDTIENSNFMQLLYQDESIDIQSQRITTLVDLYLNMPDKGFCETPLHFASKYGCVEIVKILASHPACDKNLKNRYGHTPKDIVCSRCPSASSDTAKQIRETLEDHYFVPIMASEDNSFQPFVGEPWSPHKNGKLIPNHHSSAEENPITGPVVVRAFAGPMSPKQALELHRKWKRPAIVKTSTPDSNHSRLLSIRLTDTEKGLERVGRELVKEMNVPWCEKWQFLDAFCDLATSEGLQKVERHLQQMQTKIFREGNLSAWSDTGKSSHFDTTETEDSHMKCQEPSPTFSTPKSSLDDLCTAFNKLKIHSGSPHKEIPSFRLRSLFSDQKQQPMVYEQSKNHDYDVCREIASRLSDHLQDWMAKPDADVTPFIESVKLDVECMLLTARFRRVSGLHHELATLLEKQLELHSSDALVALRRIVERLSTNDTELEDSDNVGETNVPWRSAVVPVLYMSDLARDHLLCILSHLIEMLCQPSGCSMQCSCKWPFDSQVQQSLCFESSDSNERLGSELSSGVCQDVSEDSLSSDNFWTAPNSLSPTSSCSSSEAITPEEGVPAFINGPYPTKMDLDVFRAVEDVEVDFNLYPHLYMWRNTVAAYSREEAERWPTPTAPRHKESLSFRSFIWSQNNSDYF